MCGKVFKFIGFTFLKNALNLGILTHALFPTQNSPPNSYHHTLRRGKLLISLGGIFSKICFLQQQKELKETMICFIKIQSKNMKMAWSIRLFIFCVICIFLNVMALEFCKEHLSHSVALISLHVPCNHCKYCIRKK